MRALKVLQLFQVVNPVTAVLLQVVKGELWL